MDLNFHPPLSFRRRLFFQKGDGNTFACYAILFEGFLNGPGPVAASLPVGSFPAGLIRIAENAGFGVGIVQQQQGDVFDLCLGFLRYSGLAFAKPENKQDAVQKFQVLVEKMKQETPQFAAQIDSINFLITKEATTPLTPEDKAVLAESFKPLSEWNATTCVIPPEG